MTEKFAKQTLKGFSPFTSHFSLKTAFTLAEVLITLGIIGVVAAMTIPTITANYKRQEMVGRLKKTYSILSQAFVMSENENGIFTDWDTSNGKAYFDKYWKSYIKGVSECQSIGCGYELLDGDGDVWFLLNGAIASPGVHPSYSRHSVVLSDGTFLMFMVRTETLTPENVNRIYVDINGYKKPNTFGKDVFTFQVTERGLVPFGIEKTDAEVNADCKKGAVGKHCAVLLYKNGWEVPDNYPL